MLKCSKRASRYLTLVGDKAPPAARNGNEVARALNQRCYPHTVNGGHSWCLSSNRSLSVGFFIQDEAMGVARSASCGRFWSTSVPWFHRLTFSLDHCNFFDFLDDIKRLWWLLHNRLLMPTVFPLNVFTKSSYLSKKQDALVGNSFIHASAKNLITI